MSQTIREAVECFHLLFLEQLTKKVDKRCYAVKGGCNLRFFFKSQRYSEDIDIDIQHVHQETLKKNIDNLLESRPFKNILHVHGISVEKFSTPKQTNTTQRWKILLKHNDIILPINTKIEFSRRQFNNGILFNKIDASLIQHYQLNTFLISHYDRETAIKQKIIALINRRQTQARDVFDLDLLLSAQPTPPSFVFSEKQIKHGIENISSIGFQQFKSQVIAYLPKELSQQHDDKDQWENMAIGVIEFMESYLP